MKRQSSHLFWSCLSFSALLLAASDLRGQNTPYFNPNLFDINISLGCNCTCFCETNNVDTNNPISMFLLANPVTAIASTNWMPDAPQLIPPHWTEMLATKSPPLYGDAAGDDYTTPPVGWTMTQSSISQYGISGYTLFEPVTFSLNYPIKFDLLDYYFYGDLLLPNGSGPGVDPTQSQLQAQPYPWDVNLTLKLQNGQLYYMEQQLAVGYDPEYYSQSVYPPINYVETNSLLTVSLYCTNGTILHVSRFVLKATLLNDNIPAPLDQNTGWSYIPCFYTNWSWPLTPADGVAPDSLSSPPGAAGTVQALLDTQDTTGFTRNNNAIVDHTNLLVRANRAYRLDLTYYLGGYQIETLTISNTGVVPPCTNLQFSFYTDICNYTNPSGTNLCYSTNIGLVDMMGAPDDPPGITLWAYGDNNTFSTNLSGSSLSSLPASFALPVFMVNETNSIFRKWATEALGQNTDYEYFRSPDVYPVNEICSNTVDLGDDFVMCPTNSAVVEGTITLHGCTDTNYYGGTGAVSFLQFATYDNDGLPHDPSGGKDLPLANVSAVQATNGASAFSPLNNGRGSAITEFNNPGGFTGPNSFTGQYSLKLAGLQGQPSVWSVNDLHLVFGSPVNLNYHVIETNSAYTNIDISCGTLVTNNIGLCFGLVTIPVVNRHSQPIPNTPPNDLIYESANIQITGSGPGYTVGPFSVNNFAFQYRLPYHNEADIPLFLPEGSYQYVTTVLTGSGSRLKLGTNYFTVNCCTNPCNCVPPPTNMVLWLPFDEDAVGNTVSANIAPVADANNGQQIGGPTVVPGAYVDNSLHFDGTNQYVSVPNYPEINPGTNQGFTLDAWVNRGTNTSYDSTEAAVILDKRDPLTGAGYDLSVLKDHGYDQLYLVLSGQPYGSGTNVVPADNGWHFIAVTVTPGSPGVGQIYIDGHPPVAFIPANANLTTTAPFVVGKSFTDPGLNQPWQGDIDEVEMYSRALASNEIEAIYAAGPCGKCKPAITNSPCLQVQCPPDIVTNSCTNVLVSYQLPLVTDLCCSNPTVMFDPPDPSYFPPNSTSNVTCLVYDDCGNTNLCSFTVTVRCITNSTPVIYPDRLNDVTNLVTFGVGNGPFTFSNGAWTVSGGNYVLQSTTNLSSPNWTTVSNVMPTIGYTFTNAGPVNFYRLELQTNQ